MESEPWCEAPPVLRTARSVLLYVRTDRKKRWRIAPRIRLQASLFSEALWGCARPALEGAREIAELGVADSLGHLLQGQVAVSQQEQGSLFAGGIDELEVRGALAHELSLERAV